MSVEKKKRNSKVHLFSPTAALVVWYSEAAWRIAGYKLSVFLFTVFPQRLTFDLQRLLDVRCSGVSWNHTAFISCYFHHIQGSILHGSMVETLQLEAVEDVSKASRRGCFASKEQALFAAFPCYQKHWKAKMMFPSHLYTSQWRTRWSWAELL